PTPRDASTGNRRAARYTASGGTTSASWATSFPNGCQMRSQENVMAAAAQVNVHSTPCRTAVEGIFAVTLANPDAHAAVCLTGRAPLIEAVRAVPALGRDPLRRRRLHGAGTMAANGGVGRVSVKS